jgi:hypothetical protein
VLSLMGLQKHRRLSRHSRPPEVPKPSPNYRRYDFGHAVCGEKYHQPGVWLDLHDPMTRLSPTLDAINVVPPTLAFGKYHSRVAWSLFRESGVKWDD